MAKDRGQTGQQLDVGRLTQLLGNIRLAFRLFLDDRVSTAAKAIPLAGLMYLIWPVDLLPDLFPALGQLDDIAVLLLALNWFIRVCPSDIVEEIRRGDSPSNDAETISARYTVIDDGESPKS